MISVTYLYVHDIVSVVCMYTCPHTCSFVTYMYTGNVIKCIIVFFRGLYQTHIQLLSKVDMASSSVFKDDIAGGKLVSSNTSFALSLFKKLAEGRKESVFFSPVSISIALGMTMLGAKNNTSSEMKEILFKNIDESKLHDCMSQLNSSLRAPGGEYKLHTANRLYAEESYNFLPEFLASTKEHYNAELAKVSFVTKYEEARVMINQWVEEQTVKKITDLLPTGALNELTRLVLVNAIYFKGDWESKFDKSKTTEAEFHVSDTETIKVPMMCDTTEFKYGLMRELDDTKILELPYKGGKLSMFILLPSKSLADLESKLTVDHFNNLEKWFKMRRVKTNVMLPRFKLEQSFSLKETLHAMGIKDLFNLPTADLSGMDGSRDLYVGKVIHKAFINVDEEGSEAAAATAVVVQCRCMPVIMDFHCNRPFLFFIRDNSTKSILFYGKCARP